MPPLESFMDLSEAPDTSKHYSEDIEEVDGEGGVPPPPEEKEGKVELEAGVAKTLQVRVCILNFALMGTHTLILRPTYP
jgi:hypothetical protein